MWCTILKNALFTAKKQLRKNPFYKGFSPFFLMCLFNVCVSLSLLLNILAEIGGDWREGRGEGKEVFKDQKL